MGANDLLEQLQAAQAQSVIDERRIAKLEARLATDAEKLAQIAALHYENDIVMDGTTEVVCVTCQELWPCDTARILAEPGPAVPPHAIDRDALHDLVHRYTTGHLGTTEFVDRILALVRPVAQQPGTITPDDIRKAVAPVLVSATRYPRKVQPHILGQDMGPLIEAVVARVTALLRKDTP